MKKDKTRKDYITQFYPESQFGGFTDIDGTIIFYARVNSLINASSVFLDVGCGRGNHADDRVKLRKDLRIFRGKCRKVIGIDPDESARQHPFLDEFILLKGKDWPLDDESVDLCLSDNSLEHIAEPERFFTECQRVLKPGGYLFIRTPNVMSYFGFLSMLTPHRLHKAVIARVQDGRESEDVFPAFYRCNTKRKIRRMFKKYGFKGCVYGYEAEPLYFSFSQFFYALAVFHQRFAPNIFKLALFAFGEKKDNFSND